MILSQIIHSAKFKFSSPSNYCNFKRKIQEAQKALNEASFYLTEQEKSEWGIQTNDAQYELKRFFFED
jgi:muramoyltetrapeptide carboxypeptidase LdcA involved in peptidoglycan recycling